MRKAPKKEKEASLDFRVELGRRLAELRRGKALKQAELAELLGLSRRGGQALVSRMETGDILSPSLRFVADFLRACRATFADIGDILDRYTARPTKPEERGRAAVLAMSRNLPASAATVVERYDSKTALARRFSGELPEPPAKRYEKVQRLARSWLLRQRLEGRLHQTLNQMGVRGLSPERKLLADYGRKLFSILTRTRHKESRRKALLATARAKTLEYGIARAEGLSCIEQSVTTLFQHLEVKGMLDILPTARKAEELAGLPKGRRVLSEEEMCQAKALRRFATEQTALFKFLDETKAKAAKLLAAKGVPDEHRGRYLGAVGQFRHIAEHTAAGSAERQKMTEDYLVQMQAKGCDPEIVSAVGDLTINRWKRQAQAETRAGH